MKQLKHVLVVEDDLDTRDNLCDILALDNLHVETAGSMAEVLARREWSHLSCIILDRKLPDGNAAELLPRIQRLAPNVPVIVVTGFSDLDGPLAAIRNGAADYILKPINPDALRASLVRIAERRESAEALLRSERRLRALFDNSLDGILIVDDQQRFVEVNPAACTKLGYSQEELLRMTVPQVLPAATGERFSENWETFLKAGSSSGEAVLQRKNGSTIVIEYRAVANFLPALHLASIRNLTERRQAEERARQAERLAAIGETMAGLVHEGRNALQRSSACLEMLALEVEDRPEALDLVARVQRAQEHLHQLYEEVRQYAAPINLRLEPCELRELWREVWSHLSYSWKEKQIQLVEESEPDVFCEVDRFTIGQVLRNIFENAIQASPENAAVMLACEKTNWNERPAIRIRVLDQGCGMDEIQRQQIFEPFFTTKTKGTGLGMAIVQRIVQSHRGHISVADRDGPGTEIIVILPRGNL